MPDDGNRYEFIGRRLYMTPAPVTRHQRISKRMWGALSMPVHLSDRTVIPTSRYALPRFPQVRSDERAADCPQTEWNVTFSCECRDPRTPAGCAASRLTRSFRS